MTVSELHAALSGQLARAGGNDETRALTRANFETLMARFPDGD